MSVKTDSLQDLLKQRILFIDGSMGISIANMNLPSDAYEGHEGCLEYLTITRPHLIEGVYSSFLEAGCDIIETNTFEGNAVTLAEFGLADRTEAINRKAAEMAVRTAARFAAPGKPRFVAGSVGPGTKLPSLGHIEVDFLFEAYHRQAVGLIEGGVDLIQIETCQDLLHAKTTLRAVLKASEDCGRTLPVTLLVTVEKGKMLVGTDVQTAVATFAPYDLLAFGINCSTGPREMAESLRTLARVSPFPIAVMPNAGLPRWKSEQEGYGYDLDPEEFGRILAGYVREFNIRIAGGCCGTTPRHIRALIDHCSTVGSLPAYVRKTERSLGATSLYAVQPLRVEPRPLIVGERTNASGSKKFREALLADDIEAMTEMALDQQAEGAHLLDLSLAYAGRDESADYIRLVPRLNRELKLPVAFDTTDPAVLEAALKRYAGHALINSINLEDGGVKADRFLRLAREFGSSLVCLCIDEEGMARTAPRKLEAARKILERARKTGLGAERLLFDPLTFSLATGDAELADSARETLDAIALIKKEIPGAGTILGISNVSFGFTPAARQILNSVFLHHALQGGLDAAILHAGKILPLDRITAEEVRLCENLIFNRKETDTEPLAAFLEYFNRKSNAPREEEKSEPLSVPAELQRMVVEGKKTSVADILTRAMTTLSAIEILNGHLLPAMKEVGERFGAGRMQLPFVLKSAEVMRSAVDFLGPHLREAGAARKESMVLATVKGDIHDIGKNLVDIILSNNGYPVFNIGKDVAAGEIVAAIRRFHPQYLGLSGLLVKSTMEMKDLLADLNRENISIPVICGGAALRADFVERVLKPVYHGPVHYAADAFSAITVMAGPEPAPHPANPRARRTSHPIDDRAIAEVEPPQPPFTGRRRVQASLEEILPYLNRKVLFRSRWKIKDEGLGERWLSEQLQLVRLHAGGPYEAVYGYFPANRDGDRVRVTAAGAEVHFHFPVTAGSRSIAEYYRSSDDLAVLFLATLGSGFTCYEQILYQTDEYQTYLLFHCLGVELAEAYAEFLHQRIRRELGLMKRRGGRVSPGYPSWPNLEEQHQIVKVLAAAEIGVTLTVADQLVPEQSVSALVVLHPDFLRH